ncbi:MAG: DUF4097 domain-containing protein [Candidatus Izemoplasmatales bacterium]
MSKLLRFGLAFLLIGIALVLFVSSTTSADFFMSENESYTFIEKDYQVEDLDSFSFDFSNRSVYVLKSDDEDIHLKYYTHEKDIVNLGISSEELNLKISRKWYYNIISFDFFANREYFKVYLYLPDTMVVSNLDIQTSNGRVDLDLSNNFDYINLVSSNGRINIKDLTAAKIDVMTSNGDINLENIYTNNEINLSSSNGDIILNNVSANKIDSNTTNGKIDAENITSNNIDLDSSNGRIYLSVTGSKDDYRVSLSTSNGDRVYDGLKVESGTINTSGSKVISLNSSNGDVEVSFTN